METVLWPPDRPQLAPRSATSPPTAAARSAQRSRVANGSALLPGTDGRSAWVRRAKEVIADHISDLGGEDNCSAAERSIVRRAGVLTVELEKLEARFASAGAADADELDQYARVASNLRRLLEAVGLQRRAKNITRVPSPEEYSRQLAWEEAEAQRAKAAAAVVVEVEAP